MFKVEMNFDSDKFIEEVKQDAIAQARENVASIISRIVCPVHHQTPTLVDNYGDPEHPFSVRACCEQCNELVKQAIERN
jgi:hypothetical protein